MIDRLFPGDVVIVVATPDMWDGTLFPEEEACVGLAVAKRRREFTAGRICARRALALIGVAPRPLLVAPDRTPLWPEGITGSITHCGDFCAAAVARRGSIASLGLDAEQAEPLEDHLVPIVCREGELDRASRVSGVEAGLTAKIVFSAKESAFKCWYPIGRELLDFHDVEITLKPAESGFSALFLGTASAAAGIRELRGRYAVEGPHVVTGAALMASEMPPSSSAG